jgi:hypothetical protein
MSLLGCLEDPAKQAVEEQDPDTETWADDDTGSPDDTEELEEVAVGDLYEGGIVYYLDGDGYGLTVALEDIAATYDWVPGYPMHSDWSDLYVVVPGAWDEAIGAGAANTRDALGYLGTTGHLAVNLCDRYSSDGYVDWHLPSKDELWELLQNRDLIDEAAVLHGGEPLDGAGFYWSSTQVTEDPRYVYGAYTEMWDLDGNSVGPWAGTNSKNEGMLVRAVREIRVE